MGTNAIRQLDFKLASVMAVESEIEQGSAFRQWVEGGIPSVELLEGFYVIKISDIYRFLCFFFVDRKSCSADWLYRG